MKRREKEERGDLEAVYVNSALTITFRTFSEGPDDVAE